MLDMTEILMKVALNIVCVSIYMYIDVISSVNGPQMCNKKLAMQSACQQKCIALPNTGVGFKCACKEFYSLMEDGLNCEGMLFSSLLRVEYCQTCLIGHLYITNHCL